MDKTQKLIILTGGGSGGPVTPLLALVPQLKEQGFSIAWIGTKQGIEKGIVTGKGIAYHGIAAGKLRRYFSLENIIDPFRILIGFFQALGLLSRLQPKLVMTAGGFVSVPVVWAAWALRIKVIVHQQDIRPGLANRLMAPFADVITVTFEKSLKDFGSKAVWTGNPIQEEFIAAKKQSPENSNSRPRLLILGGGTGAIAINKLVHESLAELLKICDVVHVTGRHADSTVPVQIEGYYPHEFVTAAEMANEMCQADVVVTRAGLGTLTELSYLGKTAIIIPMPDSHQEDNADFFEKNKAAIILKHDQVSAHTFIQRIAAALRDKSQGFSEAMRSVMKTGGNEAIVNVIHKEV